MAQDELIDSRISISQCKRAVEALHSHELKKEIKQQDNELLPPKEQIVWLIVAVKKMYPERKLMPFRIPIQYPLVDPRTTGVCLICKDPQREYKDLLESHGIKFISRVVGIAKLKGKFKPFEARRLLLKEHGLFLADERVIPLLPALLGKKWFEAKKQPIPVRLTRKDLKRELERAINSTYMHQNRGTCTSVKVGTISHTPSQILANIKTAIPAIANTIKGGWDNIQSFYIKTHSSVSLPIWTCSLGDAEGGRWDGLTKGADGNVSGSSSTSSTSEDEDEPVKIVGPRPYGYGKNKRTIELEEPSNETFGDAASPPPKQIQKRQLATTSTAVNTAGQDQTKPHSKKRPAKPLLSTSDKNAGYTSLVKKTQAKPPQSTLSANRPESALFPETIRPTSSVKKVGLKRRIGLVEKKKKKLQTGRLGRSAKNAIIGKKLAQG